MRHHVSTLQHHALKFAALLITFVFQFMGPTMKTQAESASTNSTEIATVGGGCFWCTEAVFERLPGVATVVSGYAGGTVENPTYEQVCSGNTGHAEVIQITFDPAKISYEKVLSTFFEAHDPTTLNRQGHDTGTQYRSVIFYHDAKQKAAAEKAKADAQKNFSSPIVTEIAPFKKIFVAEDYHQDYFKRNPNRPYCMMVIKPKLDKFDKKHK